MQATITRGGGVRGGQLEGDQQRQYELRGRRVLTSVVVALSVLLSGPGIATRAHAQAGEAREREILLGTIETREIRVPLDHDRGAAAARLLDEAMRALDGGEVMLGRRRLEILVQYYPESLAADAARQELSRFDHDRRAAYGRYATPRDTRWPEGATREPAQDNDRFGYTAPREAQRQQPTLLRTGPFGEPSSGILAPSDVSAPGAETHNRRQKLQDERRMQLLSRDFQSTAGDRVFFGETDADLGSRGRAVLVAQARWLAAHPDLPINIEAHSDDHGSAAFNAGIAERRGRVVRDRLISEGVAAARITVRAYGRERPIATCPAPECAAQNRRVVTHIGDLPPENAELRSDETRSPSVIGRSGLQPGVGRD